MCMHRNYTQEEIRFVRKNIQGRSYVEMTRLFNERFGLSITLKQMETLIYKHKLRNGLGTINGYSPPNKGQKKKKNWWKTQQGNHSLIGTERTIKIGDRYYIEVKAAEPSVWKRKHTAIWEAANGKVPKGHVVIFADGDNRNFDLDNLLLISRKKLCVMNKCGLISNHKDLTAVGLIVTDIKMMISRRKRKVKQNSRNVCSQQRRAD